MITPAQLRAGYLLASNQLANLEYKISQARMDLRALEEQAEKAREVKDAFRNAACSSCLGHGYVRVFYAHLLCARRHQGRNMHNV